MHTIAYGKKWITTAVIYQILIDRFAGFKKTIGWNTPDFLGGNLRSIIDNLPYLEELGVDAIWLSPHYQTSAYHGYHVTDYFQVDPHFGTLDDFQDLVEAVHSVGMRVIVDFVPNHCSREHPFFQQAVADRSSPYVNWFYFTRWPDEYLSFLSIHEIPKLNLEHPGVRQHILDAMSFWLSIGVDGVRLDHVIGPSHRFWQYFTEKIWKDYPSVVLLGEAWMMGVRFHELRTIHLRHKYWRWIHEQSYDSLLKQYVAELDGVLDFGVQHLFRQYFTKNRAEVAIFQKQIKAHYQRFPEGYVLPAFLDNHDMDRFLYHSGNNIERLKAAAEELFRLLQPVILYYGTESGMTQPQSMWTMRSHGDLMARMPMNWDTIDWELVNFFTKLINQRHTHVG